MLIYVKHRPDHDSPSCLRWVKTGKAQREQMFSALPPEADLSAIPTCRAMTPYYARATAAVGVDLAGRSLRGWIVEEIEEIVAASNGGFECDTGA